MTTSATPYLVALLKRLESISVRLNEESWAEEYDNIETERLDCAHDALRKAIEAIRVQATDCVGGPR